MSSIHNRITTTFTASGGNALAVMGQIEGGILGIGRAGVRTGNDVGIAERQLRAFGTTLRYAFAGTAVFALPGAARMLSNIQEQLGLMSAIGENSRGIPIVGQQLQQLGKDASQGAVAAITPISDFNSAIVNFLSTVQGVPQNQITPIVTDIAQAARLAQVPVEDATKAFTTLSVAFGRKVNRADVRRTAQEFFIMTREAPGGVAAGSQVIQQIGQLSQVTRLAGGNRPELFGLLLSSLRSGIPPSQVGRGLQFLIQTVGLPGQQTKESEQALGSVGIRAGQRMPLMERLNRIFTHARKLSFSGNLGNVARLDEDTLNDLDSSGGGSGAALKNLGITGPGAVFLGQVFHRVHALRTAIALLGQFNTGQYQQDIKVMTQAEHGHVSDINNMANAWERFRREAQLKEAGIALQRMGLQVAQIFEPVFNLAGRGLTGLSGQAAHHPDVTRGAVFGATGLAALFGLRRMGVGGLGRLASRGTGVAAGAAVAENLLSGGIPKGTVSDPLFVIVLRQLGGPGGLGPRGGGGMVPGEGRSVPGGGRGIPPLLGFGVGAGAAAALLSTPGSAPPVQRNRAAWIRHFYPALFGVGVRRVGMNENMDERAVVPQGAPQWIRDVLHENSVGVANRKIRDALAGPKIRTGHYSAIQAVGQAVVAQISGVVSLDIDYNQPDGTRNRKRVHVRVDNWKGGNTPQHRGKNKSPRR